MNKLVEKKRKEINNENADPFLDKVNIECIMHKNTIKLTKNKYQHHVIQLMILLELNK